MSSRDRPCSVAKSSHLHRTRTPCAWAACAPCRRCVPTPTNVTDGITGVDPYRSLHGIILVPRRFAPTADRLHRNAPFVHSIAKSGVGRRDSATVQHEGALRSRYGPRPRSAASGARAGRASGLSRPCATVTLFMKRRALEKVLRERGWKLLRHGGRHDIWTDGGLEEAVPRHTEINERLARAILRRVKKASAT